MEKNIVIDTDPGVDDAFAIMMAVLSRKFTIQAISTVAGNVSLQKTTNNAQFVLDFLNSIQIPVYSGADKPLRQKLRVASVHGSDGLSNMVVSKKANLTNNAAEKIAEIVNTSHNKATIVAIGPLTNIAEAIGRFPKAMKQVKEIVIMGGAIQTKGNSSKYAEFNFFTDPEAANIVFNFPIKRILVPLDVCYSVQLLASDFDQIRNRRMKKFAQQLILPYINKLQIDESAYGAVMYDPLTIFYLLNKKKCQTKKYQISIETKNSKKRGMCIVGKNSEMTNLTTVVESIRKVDFEKTFFKILNMVAVV